MRIALQIQEVRIKDISVTKDTIKEPTSDAIQIKNEVRLVGNSISISKCINSRILDGC